jgi:hypothetical protein
MSADAQPDLVYQLRVVLRKISPLIWRHLLVTQTSTITDLHLHAANCLQLERFPSPSVSHSWQRL